MSTSPPNKTPPNRLDFLKKEMEGTSSQVVRCPVCKSTNFDAKSLQYEIHRKCLDCKNEWSGGSAGAVEDPSAQAKAAAFPDNSPVLCAEDDPALDIPTYYGSPFRRASEEE